MSLDLADVVPLRCSILRGGTSRAVFFLASDLPAERSAIEPILLNVFGSPDTRQIDGVGGATSLTSKAAIIGPPSRADADVDYTFAQVSVTDPLVDWGGNCGNISTAVGPFAIDQGLVPASEPVTVVRVHNTNTSKIITEHVPVRGGRAALDGDYAVPGVPGTGARILLEFGSPAGAITGKLLPTDRPRDRIELEDGRVIEVSIVDAANPVVFVAATSIGLVGTELPVEIEGATAVTADLESIRSTAAEWLGLTADRRDAARTTPGLPKVSFVAPPHAWVTTGGVEIPASAVDLTARMMSMQTAHRSYAVTGAIATAAAAFVEGTVVHEAVRPIGERPAAETVRIGHPAGVIDAVVNGEGPAPGPSIRGVAIGRTARHILDGTVWIPRRLLAVSAHDSAAS
jgi:2-methylaconitate cis-trans-isomerase PrpF